MQVSSGLPALLQSADEHAESDRVQEGRVNEVDDDVAVTGVQQLSQALAKRRRDSEVDITGSHHHRRALGCPWWSRDLLIQHEVAPSCRG
jgi:hypothetical protein